MAGPLLDRASFAFLHVVREETIIVPPYTTECALSAALNGSWHHLFRKIPATAATAEMISDASFATMSLDSSFQVFRKSST